jgi:2,4-dienoyl-CoA reductase-like NADH-dependent reductase (Old Yellow Enzyme family)
MAPSTASPLNAPSSRTPYFTPSHLHTPGAPRALAADTPTLFTPLTIRGITLRNRIIVAPMCQYSAPAFDPAPSSPAGSSSPNSTTSSPFPLAGSLPVGSLTPYHIATLGHYALKGASLVFIEATGVQANGRITPNCPGLWSDAQIPGVRAVSDFIKSQGGIAGIQLAHAGRKASTVAPWLMSAWRKERGLAPGGVRADVDVGGWPDDVVGPMGGASERWDGLNEEESGYWPPRALSVLEIQDLVRDWGRSAQRAVEAGVQVIEIHAAHGYGIHQFLSPVSNRRTDEYGGSFEGRTRLLREIVGEIRRVIPVDMPLFVRISATEWLEGSETERDVGRGDSWKVEDTIALAATLSDLGVDLLDVSSGGNHPKQKINMFESRDYQTRIATRIRGEMVAQGKKLLIGAVGLITEAEQAAKIVDDGEGERASSAEEESESLAKEAQTAVAMTEPKNGKAPMADVILVARQFMREPEWVLRVAHQLGVDVAWPNQFLRVRFPAKL